MLRTGAHSSAVASFVDVRASPSSHKHAVGTSVTLLAKDVMSHDVSGDGTREAAQQAARCLIAQAFM